MTSASKLKAAVISCLMLAFVSIQATAQTVTVVGSAHLHQLDPTPDAQQLSHSVNALSAFEPTRVCVEMMSGERIENLSVRPEQYGGLLQSLARGTVEVGRAQQRLLEIRPADARREAAGLLARWDELEVEDRARLIGLQLAGYEFPSAILNWTHLDEGERERAAEILGSDAVEELERALSIGNEAYALGVPVAREAGLHELCGADSLEDESRGISAARDHGSGTIFERPALQERIAELVGHMESAWRPEAGPAALTSLLRFYNSTEFAELDRELQWETMHEFDNEAGAMTRRLMHWHARTAEISAELFRVLGQGPDERVLFIVGASHRQFTEASLRAQPWLDVVPAASWLGTTRGESGVR